MDRDRVKVADESDFPADGDRMIVGIEGIEIAVFRLDGEYRAVANFCPHQAGPLCEGQLQSDLRGAGDGWSFEFGGEDRIIACPWHGWRFDVRTGENLESDRYTVPTYDVEVEDGEVFVLR